MTMTQQPRGSPLSDAKPRTSVLIVALVCQHKANSNDAFSGQLDSAREQQPNDV